MNENRISIEISRDDIEAVNQAIQTIVTRLSPYLIALDADDKKLLQKIGERNLPFVEKCLQYAESNPEFLPFYVSAGEFRKDFTGFGVLRSFLRSLNQVVSNIDDTATLCGSDSSEAASAYYGAVRTAAKNGVPNANAIYEDLSVRYEAQKARRQRPRQPQ